ncbi:sugar kinase [Pseudonocardia eucalypti]|uniref:Sugar kinase n=1 Tax=Pseudonocardia eucalypti TaxID=648755 RepID=A0ABP9R9H5_9PSEU|nr:2-dehydro-3-deoxygluconokinase [Pseudonocardia eucalypti]
MSELPAPGGGVVTFGETMARLSSPGVGPMRHARSLRLGIAGAESNLAIGVRRLGVPAAWLGRVGADEFGELIRSTVAGQGVATTAIVDPDAPTGLLFKERRTATRTRVQYYRSGSAGSRLTPDDLDPELIARSQILHLTGITPALGDSARRAVTAGIELARAHGVTVSVDLNYRAALWPPEQAGAAFRELVEGADIVLATEEEAAMALGTSSLDAESLRDGLAGLGPAEVLVKRGERGALARIDGRAYEVPPRRVTVLDPVGAGDAFAAGYLASRCRGADPGTRLAVAATTGAFAVTVAGDWEGAPTLDELRLLDNHGDGVAR